jgi:hypothetical protein
VKNKPAPSHPIAAPDPILTPSGPFQGWTRFWFTPIAPLGLHALRILSGLLFLYWLIPLTSERVGLFSLAGWFDRQAHLEASRLPGGSPMPLGWSVLYLAGTNTTLFEAMWWGSLVILVLFTLGIAPRVTAVLTWVIVVSFLASPVASYDMDVMLGILALYLMIGYLLLGQWSRPLTWWERVLGPRGTSVFAALRNTDTEEPTSYAANLTLRLVQVHFVLVVITSAFHKLQFGDWWAGVAYWYPLHPGFQMDAARLRAERANATVDLFFLSLAQYIALAWQFAFPLFAFRRRWRPVLLTGAAVAWLGMIFIYNEPIVGPVYVVACLSYLSPQEWRWLTHGLRRFVRFTPAGALETRGHVKAT